ncbi:hypothetical protein DFH27DRAFT_570045 [Peziza echinospora]|nr:hypothetical protein DFH27DRAFT_570045 [Peziza echinospora]
MVRLREIPRTSIFAWSPGEHLPIIATGTVAGAVDADFSNTTQLELWDLDLQNGQAGLELAPKASINTDSRFYDIAWGRVSNDNPKGIIAGALESGSLDLWSADALWNNGDALLSSTTKHSGAIKSLQFNPFKSELLLTGGAKGEIYVWDLNNIESPFLLGNRASRSDDLDSVDWNKKIPHILATGGSSGFVTVWDVKTKRESLTLSNSGRRAVSAVAWHPENATKLITASPDDSNPVIMVWDLRNSNAPERILTGHELGVLSVSWCKQDTDLLLSSGKDNKTICWNPQTGEQLGEFPVVTNWTYQTRFNPTNPNMLATASFDGKIAVHTLQTCKADGNRPDATTASLDGEDFFNQASVDPQGPSFSLKQTPKWLQVPVGASFGFGGKLVHFGATEAVAGQPRKSKVTITKFEVETGISEAAVSFEKALKTESLNDVLQSRAKEAKTDSEKDVWKVLGYLLNSNPRAKFREYVGFGDDAEDAGAEEDTTEATTDSLSQPNGGSAKDKRLSSFFSDSNADSEVFLSDLASIPATREARTNNPFSIFTGEESEADKKITRALLLGEFEKAVDICLKEDRLSDAFMLAICGGDKCTEKVQKAYLTKKAKGPNYLRVLASVIGKNMWDVVYNADLANWKESVATLCTFAPQDEFSDLIEVLGDRLYEEFKAGEGNLELRKAASFCYLAGSKLEKVINIWIQELREEENAELQSATNDSSFSVHVHALQSFIERVTIFRKATRFQDNELGQTGDWKLGTLYEKYCEYADVVAAQGYLDVAESYLNLLPTEYPAATVSRNRVKEATKKAAPVPVAQGKKPAQAAWQPPAPAVPVNPFQGGRAPYQPHQQISQAIPTSLYTPQNTAAPPASNPYAPPKVNTQTQGFVANPYQKPQASQPSPTAYGGTNSLYTPQTGFNPPPPARTFSPPANAIQPAAKRTDIPNWNDTPIVSNLSRRGTPAASTQPITSPFPNAPGFATQSPPQVSSPFGAPPQAGRPGVPPPPKGAAPPQRVGTPTQYGAQAPPQQQTYPPSQYGAQVPQTPYGASATSYGPPPPQAAGAYAPPPAVNSRYTPTAAPATGPTGPAGRQAIPPPPPASQSQYMRAPTGPPPQTYAPPPAAAPSPYAPAPGAPNAGPYGPPPGGPQTRPTTQQTEVAPPPKPATPVPAPTKHPRGDRTHIPEQYRPIYELLSSDMNRVRSVAPPSHERQVRDTEKRLNILFDHLNNEDLLSPDALNSMLTLAQAMAVRDYATAHTIHLDLVTNRTEECTNWMTGVKRLIDMSRVTP